MTAKRWLVVGGSGRVGSMVRRAWTASPPRDVALGYQTRRPRPNDDDLVWAPLEGTEPLHDWCQQHGVPSCLVMLGGVTPGPGVDLADNGRLADACLAACAQVGIPSALVASSSAVYGAGQGEPLPEGAGLNPVNDYGRSKIEMEAVCDRWRDRGLGVTALRIGNVAGADSLMRNAVRASEASPLRLDRFADGSGPRRSYIGPGGLAKVLATLAGRLDLPPVINVGAPQPVAMQSLLEAAAVPFVFRDAPDTALQDITLDCGRLAAIHPFEASDSEARTMIDEWNRHRGPA